MEAVIMRYQNVPDSFTKEGATPFERIQDFPGFNLIPLPKGFKIVANTPGKKPIQISSQRLTVNEAAAEVLKGLEAALR